MVGKSEQRAQKILHLCRQYNVPVIEDAAYEGLYYDQRAKSLRQIEAQINSDNSDYDSNGHVIYLGTFSKVVAPGFRIGWVEAPKKVIDALIVLKQSSDLHSSSINQLVVADFLKNYSRQYWDNLRLEYAKKRDLMLSLVRQHLADKLDYYSQPKGGLFVWMQSKQDLDFSQLLNLAVEKYNIAFVPGAPFYASNPCNNTLRVSFATASPEQMTHGIKSLAEMMEFQAGK